MRGYSARYSHQIKVPMKTTPSTRKAMTYDVAYPRSASLPSPNAADNKPTPATVKAVPTRSNVFRVWSVNGDLDASSPGTVKKEIPVTSP